MPDAKTTRIKVAERLAGNFNVLSNRHFLGFTGAFKVCERLRNVTSFALDDAYLHLSIDPCFRLVDLHFPS